MSARLLPIITSIAALTSGFQTQAVAGVVISGDYYEQTVPTNSCPSSTSCANYFEPIPADKILDIRRISCFIISVKPLRTLYMGASSTPGGGTARPMYYPFQLTDTGNGFYYYSVNQETEYRMGASRYLFFGTSTSESSTGNITCTIVGKLSPR